MTKYIYIVKREYADGTQSERSKKYYCYEPEFEVGGLYRIRAKRFPGLHRVLDVYTKEEPG